MDASQVKIVRCALDALGRTITLFDIGHGSPLGMCIVSEHGGAGCVADGLRPPQRFLIANAPTRLKPFIGALKGFRLQLVEVFREAAAASSSRGTSSAQEAVHLLLSTGSLPMNWSDDGLELAGAWARHWTLGVEPVVPDTAAALHKFGSTGGLATAASAAANAAVSIASAGGPVRTALLASSRGSSLPAATPWPVPLLAYWTPDHLSLYVDTAPHPLGESRHTADVSLVCVGYAWRRREIRSNAASTAPAAAASGRASESAAAQDAAVDSSSAAAAAASVSVSFSSSSSPSRSPSNSHRDRSADLSHQQSLAACVQVYPFTLDPVTGDFTWMRIQNPFLPRGDHRRHSGGGDRGSPGATGATGAGSSGNATTQVAPDADAVSYPSFPDARDVFVRQLLVAAGWIDHAAAHAPSLRICALMSAAREYTALGRSGGEVTDAAVFMAASKTSSSAAAVLGSSHHSASPTPTPAPSPHVYVPTADPLSSTLDAIDASMGEGPHTFHWAHVPSTAGGGSVAAAAAASAYISTRVAPQALSGRWRNRITSVSLAPPSPPPAALPFSLSLPLPASSATQLDRGVGSSYFPSSSAAVSSPPYPSVSYAYRGAAGTSDAAYPPLHAGGPTRLSFSVSSMHGAPPAHEHEVHRSYAGTPSAHEHPGARSAPPVPPTAGPACAPHLSPGTPFAADHRWGLNPQPSLHDVDLVSRSLPSLAAPASALAGASPSAGRHSSEDYGANRSSAPLMRDRGPFSPSSLSLLAPGLPAGASRLQALSAAAAASVRRSDLMAHTIGARRWVDSKGTQVGQGYYVPVATGHGGHDRSRSRSGEFTSDLQVVAKVAAVLSTAALAILPRAAKRYMARHPAVTVVNIRGPILASIGASAHPGRTNVALLDRYLTAAFSIPDPYLKAVALVINSPGGSPVQSSLLYKRILELKKQRAVRVPVLAFVEDTCASGGYYVACASDEVFVDESSMVGSIGVLSSGFGMTEIAGKVGLEYRGASSGLHKRRNDPFQPWSEGDKDFTLRLLQELHQQFISVVRHSRGGKLKVPASLLQKPHPTPVLQGRPVFQAAHSGSRAGGTATAAGRSAETAGANTAATALAAGRTAAEGNSAAAAAAAAAEATSLGSGVFEGEVYTGKQAVDIGLADGIGTLTGVVRERFGDDVMLLRTQPPPGAFLERLGLSGAQAGMHADMGGLLQGGYSASLSGPFAASGLTGCTGTEAEWLSKLLVQQLSSTSKGYSLLIGDASIATAPTAAIASALQLDSAAGWSQQQAMEQFARIAGTAAGDAAVSAAVAVLEEQLASAVGASRSLL